MSTATDDGEELLTAAQVAQMFRVSPKTVGRWEKAGKLTRASAPKGRQKYRAAEVRALLLDAGEGGKP